MGFKRKTALSGGFEFRGRGERIRTFDTLVPNQVLYQTELHPETRLIITVFFINANKYYHIFILCLSDLWKVLYYLCVMINRFGFLLIVLFGVWGGVVSAYPATSVRGRAADYISQNSYNNMYPYMNNTMRTALNSGENPTQTVSQIDVLTRTKQMTGTNERRVVARRGTTSGVRAATVGVGTTINTNNTSRRVVARRATTSGGQNARSAVGQNSTRGVVARSSRTDNSASMARVNSIATVDASSNISSARCLADYTDCMNGYCQRENMTYNRCYCSAKLAQIDATYKPVIEDLVLQIAQLQGQGKWSDAEMNEYWMNAVGKYSGTNSWTNIDDALNIDWASTESRVRGQQAFATGHEYCVQHLRACYYMASNLRDAYRSEIARDCATYETSLQNLKAVAESVVAAYE